MKKTLLYLAFTMALLGCKEAFSSDYFDTEYVSDRIAVRLWQGAEVAGEDIEELFTLIEERAKSKSNKDPSKNDPIKEIEKLGKFIDDWKEVMLMLSQNRDAGSSFENIDDFIEQVNKLKNKFSFQTIRNCLALISDKYSI